MRNFDISLHWRMWSAWIFITTRTDAIAREAHPCATIATVFSASAVLSWWSGARPLVALTVLSKYTVIDLESPIKVVIEISNGLIGSLEEVFCPGRCWEFVTAAVDVNTVALSAAERIQVWHAFNFLNIWPFVFFKKGETFRRGGGIKCGEVKLDLWQRCLVKAALKMNQTRLWSD